MDIPLSIPLPGNYIVVTDGLYRLAGNEPLAGFYRIPRLRALTMWQHAHAVCCAICEVGNCNSVRAAGNITFSFAIVTNGYEAGFVNYADNLYPAGVFGEWGRNESESFGHVANRVAWTPARVAGQKVPVRVVIFCGFARQLCGWRCSLMTEDEKRVIFRQAEMLTR